MTTRRVLLTNLTLASRTGTELYVRDVALALSRRGDFPRVFTTKTGPIAEEIRSAGVPVVERLEDLSDAPDVIHGHHHLETMTALAHFPGVPAVFVSHDAVAFQDEAPVHPRIRRYVAVDEANRARLAATPGVASERMRTILNFVDLDRFQSRPPLPARPTRALLFANNAREDTLLPQVREACRRAGLSLDVVGHGVDRPISRPEEILSGYDLVFAKARCALEAAAVGCAVILCDAAGLGPPVSSADFERLRRNNFGRAVLDRPLTAGGLLEAIGRYDPKDVTEVSRRLRAEAGLDAALEKMLATYEESIAEQLAEPTVDAALEQRAASESFRRFAARRRRERARRRALELLSRLRLLRAARAIRVMIRRSFSANRRGRDYRFWPTPAPEPRREK